MNNSDLYFAAKDSKDTATILLDKASSWTNNLNATGYLLKLKQMWSAYYGLYYSDDGHKITFSGEQGELVNLPVNHMHNLGQHILNMTVANRPSMEARATNTDYKSLAQTTLANGILDYYMREKRLEKYLKIAVEYAIILGAGFIKLEWDATSGEPVDYIEETNTPIYEGDIKFTNLSPFDVVMDGTKENQSHDWMMVRSYKNKHDLAAKYPEYADKIKGLPSKSDLERWHMGMFYSNDTTDDVCIYEFYHIRTDAMPDGRYMLFVAEDIVLQDVPLPYRVLPVFRISPGDLLGTPYGYTPLFDILPIQDAMNSLYSTILTNQNAFGVQNIYVPRGADINVNQLQGGLNVIEGNAQAGPPVPLNLTNTPKEVFDFLQMLEKTAETLSGVNSVARGDPQASLKSGAALALVQSMALQFMSGLQNSYVQLIEDVGTALIKILQDFAATPRLVAIAGKSQRSFMKEFSGEDISNISRVVVDVGNALARSTAGRVQMADQLLQYQMIKNPQQYVNIINTGRLDVMTEDIQNELLLVRAENEKLVEGEVPPVTLLDDHRQHIMEHRSVIADPDLRKDAALIQRVLEHIQEHINQLKNGDPALLGLLGQQPLQPPMPPMPPQGSPEEMMQPPPQGMQGIDTMPPEAPPMGAAEMAGPGLPPEGVNLPNVPTPPPPFDQGPLPLGA